MTVKDYSELNGDHKDLLLELGNIGTGNALTSLSQLVDHPIQMHLPHVRVVDFKNLPDLIDCGSHDTAGVVIEVSGDLECIVTFILNEPFTKLMSAELTGDVLENIHDMNAMQRSAMCEIGNIMCNSYLNALASMLQMELEVSLPKLKIGSCEEVLNTFAEDFVDEKPEILFVENTFRYQDEDIMSYILLHPKFESVLRIFDLLG